MSARAMAQYGDEPVMPLQMAAQAMKGGHFFRAETIYRAEIERNNDDETKRLLSSALILQGKYHEADTLLRGLVMKDTNAEGNYWYLAMSADRQNQYDRAVFLYKKYMTKARLRIQNSHGDATENPKAWLHIGSVLRRKMHNEGITEKEWIEMMYNYEVYLKMVPNDPYALGIEDFMNKAREKRPEPNKKLLWEENTVYKNERNDTK